MGGGQVLGDVIADAILSGTDGGSWVIVIVMMGDIMNRCDGTWGVGGRA